MDNLQVDLRDGFTVHGFCLNHYLHLPFYNIFDDRKVEAEMNQRSAFLAPATSHDRANTDI